MLNKISTKTVKVCRSAMLILFIGMTSIATTASAIDLSIVGPEWAPINGKDTDPKPGYVIDLVKAILQPAGYTVTYKNVPSWQKAVQLTREGIYNCVSGAAKYETPDFIFPKESVGSITTMFYVKKGDAWRYNNDFNNLKTKRFGLVSDNNYGQELNNFLKQNTDTVAVSMKNSDEAVQENIAELINGKLDVILETDIVIGYYLKKMNLLDKIEPAGALSVDDIYIACSPATDLTEISTKVSQLLTDGVRKMRSDGSLTNTLSPYGINDWAK